MHLQEGSECTNGILDKFPMLESPEMFGSLPQDPNNDWIKLSKLAPWREFDLKYADNFKSKKGQRANDSRMALGALLIKPAYNTCTGPEPIRFLTELSVCPKAG